ncbi:hypothetical protein ACFQ07_03330 [Actinomadura adrarensis]|uniref:Uncharacterized protein n=1 Tax=Actinomadura adrarensis TaxID=1819600 RepID=A0ABW3CBC3_9ACTN
MPNTPQHPRIDIQEVRTRSLIARETIAVLNQAMPHLGKLWHRINLALDDTPALVAELATVRRHHANLVAAARATLKAQYEGESEPLYYLCDELRAQGHLPPESWGRS